MDLFSTSRREPIGRRATVLLLAMVTGLLLIAGCGSSDTGSQSTSGGSKKVRINSVGGAADVPIYLAMDRGYFTAEGIDVELIPVKNTSDVPGLLSSGQLEFALSQPSAAFFNGVNSGFKDPVVLATTVFTDQTKVPGLIGSTKAGVRSVADLRGKKIAVVGPKTSSQYFAELSLARAGLQPGDAEFTVMGAADMLPALANGAVGGAWMFEPLASKAVGSGSGVLLASVGDVASGFPSWLQASEKLAKDDKGTIEKVVRAVTKAQADYRREIDGDGRDGIVSVLTKHTTLKSPEDWADVELPSASADGSVDSAVVDAFQQYLLDNKSIEKKVDLTSVVDMSFRDSAIK